MAMHEAALKKKYPRYINVDEGTIFDRDADDNFFLHNFESVKDYADIWNNPDRNRPSYYCLKITKS